MLRDRGYVGDRNGMVSHTNGRVYEIPDLRRPRPTLFSCQPNRIQARRHSARAVGITYAPALAVAAIRRCITAECRYGSSWRRRFSAVSTFLLPNSSLDGKMSKTDCGTCFLICVRGEDGRGGISNASAPVMAGRHGAYRVVELGKLFVPPHQDPAGDADLDLDDVLLGRRAAAPGQRSALLHAPVPSARAGRRVDAHSRPTCCPTLAQSRGC